MRPTQLAMLKQTNDVRGQPFDLIDIGFGLLTAVSGSPIAFLLAIVQYFARRSATVCEAMLVAMNVPDVIATTQPIRGVLPGVNKLLPETAADEPARQDASDDEDDDPFTDRS